MKRPFCIVSIIYLLGILIGLYFIKSIAFLCIGILIVILSFYLFPDKRKLILVFSLILSCSASFSCFLEWKYQNSYPMFLENETIHLNAIVVSDPIEKEYQYVYTIKVKEKYLLLSIKKEGNVPSIQYGDEINVQCQIEVPEVARNYHGFNYQEYLKTKKIYGITKVNENQVRVVSKNKIDRFRFVIHFVKNHIQTQIYKVLPKEEADLCIGFLIGERNDISEEITTFFRESNLMHLLAISGTHISYLILGISFICNRFGKRFSKIITILFLLFFMALTNYTASVTRASIMAILSIIASLLHRKSDVYQNMAIATLIILINNPYTIFDIGFQLSFAGTLGIVLWQDKLSMYFFKEENGSYHNNFWLLLAKVKKNVLAILLTTVSANLMILPIMAFHFRSISITFCISNLLISPFIGAVIFGGFLLYFISLFCFPFVYLIKDFYYFILIIVIQIAKYCSYLPGSVIYLKTPSIFSICSYYCFLFLFFYYQDFWKRNQKKIFVVFICIFFIFPRVISLGTQELNIYFIDVGQGDSTLICTSHTSILIDGGGNDNGFAIGEKVLLPYLLDRGVNQLDYIMISHFDSDHVGRDTDHYGKNKSEKYYDRETISNL